ncbi:GtrA family protein [Absicoccus intestinalis]|uniref:GtrA family protein n=1 Tax=Absicoccus intestinalis TaxID=2926319 RepID=A0ABU4WLS4_9FIRM|nr:GtrA family protein [Absicoccus sp. CLA-KB-P134]MDX8417498.1 GtrA family protein [Absicoccus sp. CLA-KB-P134]
MKNLIKQLFRFGIVGGIAFLIDYSVLFICTEYLGIYYLISSFISFTVSTVFNYIASVRWVFDVDQKKSQGRNFVLFIVFSVIGLGINQCIMWFGVEKLDLYYMLVKIGATAIVMVFNFVTRKMFLE